jgi:3-oxoacyl-[acyl-carrier protein] reductase
MIPIDLAGKVALVTGASQGLGAATARALVRAGAAVAINYFPDPAGACREQAVALAEELGPLAAPLGADVRHREAVGQLVEQVVARWGRLDLVVNNAGILRDRTLAKMTAAEWQDVIDTNLTGVFHVCQAAAARLADRGRIVNVASVSAFVGVFGQSNYAAAKAGVIGLTKTLSRELARRQITVNAVAPGVVLTEMGRSIPEAHRQQMLGQVPLGRFGEAEEVAHAIVFLCSELAGYITGQTLHVNGGWWG